MMNGSSARQSEKLFRCQKSNRDLPLADPHCANPSAYCKWRTACPINLLEKEAARSGE